MPSKNPFGDGKKVSSVPQGYKKAGEADGKTYYTAPKVIKQATRTSNPTGGAEYENFLKKQLQSGVTPEQLVENKYISPDSVEKYREFYKPDVVYTEPQINNSQTNYNIPLGLGTNVDRKSIFTGSTDYSTFQYPDVNKGYSSPTTKHFDIKTQKEIDPIKSYVNGNYIPNYIGDTPDVGTLKNNVPMITDKPIVNNEVGKSALNYGFKDGGKVKSKLTKGYVAGGPISSQDASFQNAFSNANQPTTTIPPRKKNNFKIDPRTAQGLGAAAMTVGNQLYNPPENLVDSQGQQQMDNINTGVDSAAGSLTPWYGLAKGASNIGKSFLAKDQYGYAKNGANRAANDWLTPTHESTINAFKNEGAKEGVGEFLGMRKIGRTASNLLGKTNATSGFWGKVNDASGILKQNQDRQENVDAIAAQQQAIENERLAEERRQKDALAKVKISEALSRRESGLTGKYAGYADGGVIRGAGTAKSDSINAKVKPGSFVVPAENAHIAKELKEKVLMKAPNVKAKLNQGGGVDVRLSNGEMLFDPEEKAELEKYGYDIDALAPNAEYEEGFANGGPTPEKAREILKDGTIRGKNITDRQRRYFGWLANGKKDGGDVKGYYGGGYVSPEEKAARKEAEQLKKDRPKAINRLKQIELESNQLKNSYNTSPAGAKMGIDSRLKELAFESEGIKNRYKITPDVVDYTSTRRVPTVKKSVPATETVAPFDAMSFAKSNPGPEDVPMSELASPIVRSQYDTASTVNGVDPNQLAYERDLAEGLNRNTPSNAGAKSGKGFDLNSALSSVVGYGLPLAQTAIALRNLKKLGNRPVDKIDPEYLGAIDKQRGIVSNAEAQAKYGMTGDQLADLRMQNNNLTNAGRYAARNYSGGSPAVALNTERSVINDAYGRALNSKISDNALKLQKQQIAADRNDQLSGMLEHKAELSRRLFNDSMANWQQNQASNANLLSAGLSNGIDQIRYDKFLKDYQNAQVNQ